MIPQEKAEELVNKYLAIQFGDFPTTDAKKCALIAVDEIIKFMEMDDEYNDCLYFANSKWVQYLIEVKQEIEKL
jgi:hypothetical protein